MNFINVIFSRLEKLDNVPILVEVQNNQLIETKAHQLLGLIEQVRNYLKANNVKQGDRVVLIAPNSVHWVAIDLATLATGAILVPIYSRLPEIDLDAIIGDCTPEIIIRPENYDEIFKNENSFKEPITPHSISTIIYTSGTSGKAKGVMLSNDNISFICQQTANKLKEMLTSLQTTEPKVFHYLPLCFAGSRLFLWTQLYLGQSTYLSMDLQKIQDELKVVNPHFFLNVPLFLERIKKRVEEAISKNRFINKVYKSRFRSILKRGIKYKIGSHLKFLICGSASLDPMTQKWYEEIGIPILQIYGLTETTGIISMDTPGQVAIGSVGFPIPGCEIKISDGELLCKGPNIFPGYWNHQVKEDQWFHTGDQVELDVEGRLKIIGRTSEVIVLRSGHKVAPAPLEKQLLKDITGAEHVVIIGHDQPYLTALVTGPVNGNLNDFLEQYNLGKVHYQKIHSIKKLDTSFSIQNGFMTANGKLRRQLIYDTFGKALYS